AGAPGTGGGVVPGTGPSGRGIRMRPVRLVGKGDPRRAPTPWAMTANNRLQRGVPPLLNIQHVMIRLFVAFLSLVCALGTALAAGPPLAEKSLLVQVQRLTELLRDSHAVGYPKATMAQAIDLRGGRQLVLAVFTVEGFGGGNNHSQFLAAFDADEGNPP